MSWYLVAVNMPVCRKFSKEGISEFQGGHRPQKSQKTTQKEAKTLKFTQKSLYGGMLSIHII